MKVHFYATRKIKPVAFSGQQKADSRLGHQ